VTDATALLNTLLGELEKFAPAEEVEVEITLIAREPWDPPHQAEPNVIVLAPPGEDRVRPPVPVRHRPATLEPTLGADEGESTRESARGAPTGPPKPGDPRYAAYLDSLTSWG
jgi:hypothetical protein